MTIYHRERECCNTDDGIGKKRREEPVKTFHLGHCSSDVMKVKFHCTPQ